MSKLVVITYPNKDEAGKVLQKLRELQKEYLIDLEDAAYIVKDGDGKVHLNQMYNLSGVEAVGGAFWGLLFGALLFVPIAGMAVGAATGALVGKASDYGIDDAFIKRLSQEMTPNSSAIFILARRAEPEKVIPEIKQYGGTILQTSLSPDAEQKLKAAWAERSAAQ